MGMHKGASLAIGLACVVFAPVCGAQQLIIGNGASLSLGDSRLDAGCHDLQVAGTLNLGAGTLRNVRDAGADGILHGGTGTLSLSGDLSLGASLQAQGSTVRMVDGCNRMQSQVLGNHQFNFLSVQTDNGYALVLPAGGTQSIGGALELIGGVERQVLRSSAPGIVSFLALDNAGTQLISRVDAMDVGAPPAAQYLAMGTPASFDSLDGGNTPRFFAGPEVAPLVPLPALSTVSLFLMTLLMIAFATVRLQSPARGDH